MKRLHLIIGLIVVVVFLLTGQYMEYVHNRDLPDGTRMLYRSRHIYLLLAGLLNLVLGTYVVRQPQGWRGRIQAVGTILIVLSPVLLLAGFFSEPHKGPERTIVAALGIFSIAIGTVLHALARLKQWN
jgi:peptidoglycan/LPS O-acetylase OafA/YrhL